MYFQLKENDQRETRTLEYKAKLAEHAYGLEKMDVGLLLVDQWENEFGSSTYMTDNNASQFEKESDQKRQENKDCYFFNQPRPPEVADGLPKEHRSWILFSLKDMGWGPPTCMACMT